MHSSHERPTPSVKGEVTTTIHHKPIPPGSGETPKDASLPFGGKEECDYITIVTPRIKEINIRNHHEDYNL